MHIKVPGKFLNGGATATALYNYTNAAEIKWGRKFTIPSDIKIIEQKDSYVKVRLENQKYSGIMSVYQGTINEWIVTDTWHCNLQTGLILKYTFDDKAGCDDFINYVNTHDNDAGKCYCNCNLCFDNEYNGFLKLRYLRVTDTIVYVTFKVAKIGKIKESNYIGFAWTQISGIGGYAVTGTLELEYFNPYFNDPEMQGFINAPDKETARHYYIKLFKRLKSITNTRTLYLNSIMLNYLTDEDKKIATDKGWTLA